MFEIVVVGAGMAGASAAYALALAGRRVALLERESLPGYHSTGRSAAVYTRAYGNAVIRGLTAAGKSFFDAPPPGFADVPLLLPRGVMFIGHAGQREALAEAAEAARRFVPEVALIEGSAARTLVPILRQDYVAGAVLEPEARDIDVNTLHQGFLRGLKAAGGALLCDAEVCALSRVGDDWRIETKAGALRAAVVVNAAGAWCDEMADLAGVARIGLVPKRRTAIIFAVPPSLAVDDWPAVIDVMENFYFKPDAGRLLGSPADETPVPPSDVQPEELDVAIAADRIQQVTTVEIRRIERKWAGLRSFVADKTPVVGFDPAVPGFFWLAGQGGYGIQTAPALARVVAGLITEGQIPGDIEASGVTATALSPGRLHHTPPPADRG